MASISQSQNNPGDNKKTVSETGHAKNVANFADLIAYCTAYGATYSPPKTVLQLTSLQTLLTSAQAELAHVTTAKNTFDTATGDRQLAFEPLKPLATKIVNFIAVTDATTKTNEDAKTINNKLQGRRAKTIPHNPPVQDGSPKNTISVSRQSYDMLTENFAALIDLAESITSYTPNETELKITSLKTFHNKLQTANTTVINAEVAYSNTRISRDQVLYAEGGGLVNIASDVKKYVKAIFGATSAQYRQISGIKFTKH